jgi:hypothetical protein
MQIPLPLQGAGGLKKKGYLAATLLYICKKQKMRLPYEFSLSHHQLLFIALIFICYGKDGNTFH